MPLSLRITAGVRIAAAVVGIATLLGPSASAVAGQAEVQAAAGPAQTLICRVDRKSVPPTKESEEPYRLLILAPNLVRIEQPDGTYAITDFARRKSLMVDPARSRPRCSRG